MRDNVRIDLRIINSDTKPTPLLSRYRIRKIFTPYRHYFRLSTGHFPVFERDLPVIGALRLVDLHTGAGAFVFHRRVHELNHVTYSVSLRDPNHYSTFRGQSPPLKKREFNRTINSENLFTSLHFNVSERGGGESQRVHLFHPLLFGAGFVHVVSNLVVFERLGGPGSLKVVDVKGELLTGLKRCRQLKLKQIGRFNGAYHFLRARNISR